MSNVTQYNVFDTVFEHIGAMSALTQSKQEAKLLLGDRATRKHAKDS